MQIQVGLLTITLLLLNLYAFCLFGLDKYRAKIGAWRIPEARLLLAAALGGSVGALLGMGVFHHKTRKNKFRWGVPAILLVQLAGVLLLMQAGLLVIYR